MSNIPPFIQAHIIKQKKVVEQRKLAQRKMKNMANYNIPDQPPRTRRDYFGSMSQPHTEIIMLDGKTYTMWYENEAQKQQLMDEYRRKKFGVASEGTVDDFKENIYGMM